MNGLVTPRWMNALPLVLDNSTSDPMPEGASVLSLEGCPRRGVVSSCGDGGTDVSIYARRSELCIRRWSVGGDVCAEMECADEMYGSTLFGRCAGLELLRVNYLVGNPSGKRDLFNLMTGRSRSSGLIYTATRSHPSVSASSSLPHHPSPPHNTPTRSLRNNRRLLFIINHPTSHSHLTLILLHPTRRR
jgi:hypothetical protein